MTNTTDFGQERNPAKDGGSAKTWSHVKKQKDSKGKLVLSGKKTPISINPIVKEQLERIIAEAFPYGPVHPAFPDSHHDLEALRQQQATVQMMMTLATACSLVALKAANDPAFAVQTNLASRFRDVLQRAAQYAISDPRILQQAMMRANSPVPHVESIQTSLTQKSLDSEIPIEVLLEVFERGVNDYPNRLNKDLDLEQYAFNRVNSFIAGGRAAKIDEDLINELSKKTLGNYIKKASDSNENKFAFKTAKQRWVQHSNRKKGINRAVRKLTGEEVVNELSDTTREAYIRKAIIDPKKDRRKGIYTAIDKNEKERREPKILVVKKGDQDVKRVPAKKWKEIKKTHNLAEMYVSEPAHDERDQALDDKDFDFTPPVSIRPESKIKKKTKDLNWSSQPKDWRTRK